MSFEDFENLKKAFQDALDATEHSPTKAVIRWLTENRSKVIEANRAIIEERGLADLIREFRKNTPPRLAPDAARNLCFDFGIPEYDYPSEISIPLKPDDPLYGRADWREIDDATLDDVIKHIALLKATAAATVSQAEKWEILLQAAVQVVPGRFDITIRDLRRILKDRMSGHVAD